LNYVFLSHVVFLLINVMEFTVLIQPDVCMFMLQHALNFDTWLGH